MSRYLFNDNWQFCHLEKNGEWEAITLPHDAMLGEPRTADSAGGTNTGWFAGYDYVYEKVFNVPEKWRTRVILFEFEGIYQHAEVYINGKCVSKRPNGYISFYVSANQFLEYGKQNQIRVIARNADQPNSRWYSGAGIYRSVWLWNLPHKHIMPDGIRITTLDYQTPMVQVEIEASHEGRARIEFCDCGQVFAEKELEILPDLSGTVKMVLKDVQLWEVEQPYLYTCRVIYGEDVREVEFGIRQVECDSKKGCCINGKRVILKGACIHHDNGILGAAAHPFAEERKVRLLKEAGFNAIRSAHNPCSDALLKACDRQGMLVLDEYVDMWYIHKTKNDYASYFETWWKRDLQSMVDRDYNHPSVVMYSIGNEVSETAQRKGIELCTAMTEFLHEKDRTRPVTCGINIFFNFLSSLGLGVYSDEKAKKEAVREEDKEKKSVKKKAVGSEFFNNMAGLLGADFMKIGATLHGSDVKTREAFAVLDVAGYNYGINRYKKDLKKYPDRVILGSETFCFDASRFWNLAKENPALIGDFVWTGMDYLGEVGIGAMEYKDYAPEFEHGPGWIAAGVGMLDLTGQLTSQMAYMQVAYEQSPIRLGVIPADHAFEKHSPSSWRMSNARESWAWNGCEGKKTKVEVYARGETVELFLNGEKIGCKPIYEDCRAEFKVTWKPGKLSAIVYGENGEELGRAALCSAGEQTCLELLPEEKSVSKEELCYVRLRYTDQNGEVKPLCRGDITVKVQGGTLLGLGNACPYNERGYLTNVTDTYYGEALAIIRPDGAKEICMEAESPYGNAQAVIPVTS